MIGKYHQANPSLRECGTRKSNSVQLWHWSTSDMLGNERFAYRRAILLPSRAHNGFNSNTLKRCQWERQKVDVIITKYSELPYIIDDKSLRQKDEPAPEGFTCRHYRNVDGLVVALQINVPRTHLTDVTTKCSMRKGKAFSYSKRNNRKNSSTGISTL